VDEKQFLIHLLGGLLRTEGDWVFHTARELDRRTKINNPDEVFFSSAFEQP